MTVNLISTIIYSIIAGALVLAMMSSVHRIDPKQSGNGFLFALLLLLLLHTLGELLIVSGGYRYAPQLVGLESPLRMLMGPALYLYTRSMICADRLNLWRTCLTALIGPTVIVLLMMPFFMLSVEERLALANPAQRNPELWRMVLTICLATSLLFVVFTWAYLVAAMRLQAQHRQQMMKQWANIEACSLDWLKIILVVWGGVWMLYTLEQALWLLNIHPQGLDLALASVKALAVVVFAHLAISQSSSKLGRPISNRDALAQPQTEGPQREPSLAPERMARIADKLRQAMEHDQLFTNNDLSLRQLSDATKTSVNHLSETFSQHLKTNFFQFVNAYRVAEAKQLLATGDRSVTDIAYDVGYNSRSTFNSAFKKETGLTPTGYRNHVRDLDREESLL